MSTYSIFILLILSVIPALVTTSLLAKIVILILITALLTVLTIEKWEPTLKGENNIEKLGVLFVTILITVLITQGVSTPWLILLIEIQTYIILSGASWLRGSPKLIFTEACITYVFPAALSTFTMSIGLIIYMYSGLNSIYPSMFISLAMLIKVGAVPFYIWVKTVYRGISWSGIIILGIMNKVGIIVILSLNMPSGYAIYLLVGILTVAVGSVMASNQLGLKELWGFSGVASMGLIVTFLLLVSGKKYSSLLLYSPIEETLLLLITYSLSLLSFICLTNIISLNNQNEINFKSPALNKSTVEIYVLVLALVGVAGIPPFAGFAIKFILLSEILNSSAGSSALIILLFNLPLVMAYLRLINKIIQLEPKTYYHNITNKLALCSANNKLAITMTLINMLISLLIIIKIGFNG